MKKSKYSKEQIAFALRQAETGTRVAEVCRKLGISELTFEFVSLFLSLTLSFWV